MRMTLNTIAPNEGAKIKRVRVGRGIGSGLGKTCGRGHKGQKARAGGYHKMNFEGGQMPMARRLPKFGFNSHLAKITAEVKLEMLEKLPGDVFDLNTLKVLGVISHDIKRVKIFSPCEISKKLTIKGLMATKSVKAIVEEKGGVIEG